MPPPRLLAICLGPVVAAAVLVAQPAQLSDAARPPEPHSAIVATSLLGGATHLPDGSVRAELPWLLPGDGDPAVSPDGSRLAFSSARTGNREIYVADTTTGELRRLTASRTLDDRKPAWSPDGRRIVWQTGAAGRDADLFVMRADGLGKRPLAVAAGDDIDPAWSPDGTRIAFASNRSGGYDLWLVPSAGGEATPLLDLPGATRAPAWSPDGRQLAYSGTSGGGASIWILRLDPLATRRITNSSHEDLNPDWSPAGGRLTFTRADRGHSRTWVIRARNGVARPVAGTEGDVDPVWSTTAPTLAPGPEQRLPDLDQRPPWTSSQSPGRAGSTSDSPPPWTTWGRHAPDPRLAAGEGGEHARRPGDRAPPRRGTLVVRDVGTLRFQSHTPPGTGTSRSSRTTSCAAQAIT